jgi:hypothetical protein
MIFNVIDKLKGGSEEDGRNDEDKRNIFDYV